MTVRHFLLPVFSFLIPELADEIDSISTWAPALTRYKHNRKLMNEVLMYTAFRDPATRATAAIAEEGRRGKNQNTILGI